MHTQPIQHIRPSGHSRRKIRLGKSSKLFAIAWSCLAVLTGTALSGSENPGGDPVSNEERLIAEVRAVATATDPDVVVDRLSVAVEGLESAAPSVVLARRAMALCGWLRNDNELGRAMRVAERVLQNLETMGEATDVDRVERLYWEAMLLADILDQKAAALARLQRAEELAPNDDRIMRCEEQLAQALAEFGR